MTKGTAEELARLAETETDCIATAEPDPIGHGYWVAVETASRTLFILRGWTDWHQRKNEIVEACRIAG